MKKGFLVASAFCFFLIAALGVAGCKARAGERFLDIQEVTSPGGITAWLVEDHSLPVLSLEFSFRGAGAALDPPDKQGLARLVSNTMDEGAGDRDSRAFQKALSDNSITLYFKSSRDDYSGTLKTLTRKRDLAFDLLRDAVSAPRFDGKAVERMRAANLANIRASLSDPDWLAARLMNDVAYQGHPYAMNSGGTLSTLLNVTTDDLRSFASKRLARDNLVVVAVGDIDAQVLGIALDRVFGGLPEKADIPSIAGLEVQNQKEVALYKKDIPQSLIQIMMPGIGRDDVDWYKFHVMNFIFGSSGFGSRLTEEIREKRGLTYGIFSGNVQLDHLKAISIATSTENKNAGEILSLIRAEMEKMRAYPVTDKELADAKSYLIGAMPLALSSTDAIAGLILGLRMEKLPIDYLDRFKDRIAAVSAKDVQETAQRLLDPEKMTVAIVGAPEGVTPTRLVETLPNVE